MKELKDRNIKKYKPHCPNPNCRYGFDASRLNKVEGTPEWIPPEILKIVKYEKGTEQLYKCNYCDFVWLQDNSKLIGFDPRPVGFLLESGFVFTPKVKIRKENTPYFYLTR